VYQQNVPGYAIMYVFFIIATLAASIHKEKQDGTFRRLLAAPIGNAAMLAGKLLPYYIVNLIQIVVLFGIGAVVFKMDLGPHPLALVPISLLLSACAVSLGLLLATLSKNEAQANSMAPAIVIVLAAIGGCMVPPVVMPEFMTNLAHISPAGWALFGYQDVMVRGQDVLDTLPTLGVLAAYTVVLFGIATRRFRFN
jgi:ABC-2 type transport system permease protein